MLCSESNTSVDREIRGRAEPKRGPRWSGLTECDACSASWRGSVERGQNSNGGRVHEIGCVNMYDIETATALVAMRV
jgi:hypothetical protein